MKTGIIGAMELEILELKARLDSVSVKTIAGMDFYSGEIAGNPVTLVQCGVGKVNAGICAQILILSFGADRIINIGVAGAIAPILNIGDIVISKDVVQHDFDTTAVGDALGVIPGLTASFCACERLIESAKKAGDAVLDKNALYIGRIATGDQFISAEQQKKHIAARFDALCAEMEGGAIAQVCVLNNVPFVVIRAVSDKADDSASVNFEEFAVYAAKNSSELVYGMLSY